MAERIRTLADLAAAADMSRGELEHAIRVGAVPSSALTTTSGGHRRVKSFAVALEALRAYKGGAGASDAEHDFGERRTSSWTGKR